MRLLALPMTLILVAVLVYLLVVLLRNRETPSTPRWEVDTALEDGWTLVVVRKVVRNRTGVVELARQTVRAIPDDDPSWEERYQAALTEARNRVSVLELGSG